MESPVRICLGAALVVFLLLVSGTEVYGSAVHETTSTTVKDERAPRYARLNNASRVARPSPKTPDVALNELSPKESVSEEHTDKNAKYKDRGRVRFNTPTRTSSTTDVPKRKIKLTSEPVSSKLMIVTPEPEKKNVSQIMEGMRVYKKTKMPVLASSRTTPVTVDKREESEEEEDEEEDDDDFNKFTSDDFHQSSSFTAIPSFGDDDTFPYDTDKEATETKEHKGYSSPSFSRYSSYFPKDSYKPNDYHHDSYENDFHDFNTELTTPKNDFFDSKYKEISSSIIKNLDSIKLRAPPSTKPNIQKENANLEKFNNRTPGNKSSVYIKNTKEIRMHDNEGAAANHQLSDVHGTSVYYETSVLSTETYTIDNQDDCDNDTSPFEPTPSASNEEELSSFKVTLPTVEATKPTVLVETELINLSSSSFPPVSSSVNTVHMSSPNAILSTAETSSSIRQYSSTYSRNRNAYKELNPAGTKEPKQSNTDLTGSNQIYRTRKFHYTTPKTKPVWMAPRRNITRAYSRSTFPTTIYSEYFNIKDKFTTTPRPRQPTRTALTTVSSEIDPVLQTDIGGVKKVVSQSISDNSIPTLWKRGSTKFTSSTASSTEVDSISELEIPPTSAAWALASMISPPSLANPKTNETASTQKSVDENELQKVGEISDKKEDTTTTSTTAAPKETISETITEIDQNKIQAWRPIVDPTASNTEIDSTGTQFEQKPESMPAESVQSTVELATSRTNPMTRPFINTDISAADYIGLNKTPHWINVNTSTVNLSFNEVRPTDPLSAIYASRPEGFESITKLPAGLTTPNVEDFSMFSMNSNNDQNTAVPATTKHDTSSKIYPYTPVVKAESTESSDDDQVTTWHPATPPHIDKIIEEAMITTYRPKLVQTTIMPEDITTEEIVTQTTMTDTETTSQKMPTEEIDTTVEITTIVPEPTTDMEKVEETTTSEEQSTVTQDSPASPSQETTIPSEQTTMPSEETTVMQEETTTIIVGVVTEINSERATSAKFTTKPPVESTEMSTEVTTDIMREEQSTSEENSNSNEVITKETKSTTIPTTTLATNAPRARQTTESKVTEAITEPMKVETTSDVATEMRDVSETDDTTTLINKSEDITETTIFEATKSATEQEELTSYASDVTTEASTRLLSADSGSGAAVAIAVSTIGVIALILLIGLLLIVRRRGRRVAYGPKCTPVSLDAYSLDSVSVGHRKGTQRFRSSKRSYGNPAYEDEVTSHPMQYAALANFALDVNSITAEFAEIPSVNVKPDEVPPGCEDKNRYSNILPLPDTRVPLQRIGSDPTSEYINANYVTGPGNIKNYYIACQAPLPNTVADLWRMVWEQNSRLIVMLTEYMENGVEQSYEYLPPSEITDNRRIFGDFQIILKKREQKDKYAISTVQLINLRTRTWREVTHMWYFWPARGVPDDYDSVIDFLSEMRGYMKTSQMSKEYDEEGVEVIYEDMDRSSFHNLSKFRSDDNSSSGNGVNVYSPQKAEEHLRRHHVVNGTLGRMKAASEVEGVRPCVVVCASGAGRSGAVIALDICARALAAGAVDVPRVVRELRAQRPHALANKHYYIFVYKVLSDYGYKLMGGGVDTI